MGSCSLLQGIFLTQESNPGLLHCRWILYQLSHQRSIKGESRFFRWLKILTYLLNLGGASGKESACQHRRHKRYSWKDPLEEVTATHFSILAWEISWTGEPGRLQSMGLQSRTWLSTQNLRRKINKNLWMQGSKVTSRITGGNQPSWWELLLGRVKDGVAHTSAPLRWIQDELERSPVAPLH